MKTVNPRIYVKITSENGAIYIKTQCDEHNLTGTRWPYGVNDDIVAATSLFLNSGHRTLKTVLDAVFEEHRRRGNLEYSEEKGFIHPNAPRALEGGHKLPKDIFIC